MPRIPLVDVKAQYAPLIPEVQLVFAEVVDSGVFILGPRAGMALIETLPDVEGVIVTSGNEVLVSSGLTARLERLRAPTDAP